MRFLFARFGISWLLPITFVLLACATPKAAYSQGLRALDGPYELEVLADGTRVRTFERDGETYILGHARQRYVLRIHNRSGRRIEAVVSVDGLDVIDGKPGDLAKRGYLVPAYGSVDIDGWRLSDRQAAAFRFAPIAESYAAKTGRARNVGVIGVAVFPERRVYVAPRRWLSAPRPAPMDNSYGSGRSAELAPPPAAKAEAGASASAADDEAVAEAAPRASRSRSRSGLGTEFGEAVGSQVHEVTFTRANARVPAATLGARYNDRRGLLALGIDVDADAYPSDLALRQTASPFPVSDRRYAAPPAGWRGR